MRSRHVLCRLLALAEPSKTLPALLAGIFAAASGIALIGAAAWIIASAALQPPLSALTLGVTGVRACGIGRAVFRYLDRLLSHRLAFSCYEELQQATYQRAVQEIPLRSGNVHEGAFLHDLLTGCDTLRDFYLRTAPQPIIAGLLTALTCAALLPLTPPGACAVALLYILHLTLPHLLLQEQDLRTESAAYRASLLDLTEGRIELHAAGTITQAKHILSGAAETFQCEQGCRRNQRDRLFTTLDLLRVMGWVLLILLLIPHVMHGTLTGVQYAVWVLVLEAVFSEYRPLPAAILGLTEALRAGRHIMKEHLPVITEGAAAQSICADDVPLVQADHISFGYQKDIPILHDLSFRIHRGEHTAIIGESGAGKTTLASLLLRLWEVDEGILRYCGNAHTAYSPTDTRALFGASLQGSYLFSASVRENFLRLHGVISEIEMWEALDTAQLADVIKALPAGLDESLGTNASRLSGGQRSRLLTALALASGAPILLLDEPTAGLDAMRAARLIECILASLDAKGRTLIVITHDLPLLSKMKQVIEL